MTLTQHHLNVLTKEALRESQKFTTALLQDKCGDLQKLMSTSETQRTFNGQAIVARAMDILHSQYLDIPDMTPDAIDTFNLVAQYRELPLAEYTHILFSEIISVVERAVILATVAEKETDVSRKIIITENVNHLMRCIIVECIVLQAHTECEEHERLNEKLLALEERINEPSKL